MIDVSVNKNQIEPIGVHNYVAYFNKAMMLRHRRSGDMELRRTPATVDLRKTKAGGTSIESSHRNRQSDRGNNKAERIPKAHTSKHTQPWIF